MEDFLFWALVWEFAFFICPEDSEDWCPLTTVLRCTAIELQTHSLYYADLMPYLKPFKGFPSHVRKCSFGRDWVCCFLLQGESNGLFESRAQVLSVLCGLSKVPLAAREKAKLRLNMAISINQALSNESAWHRPAVFSFAMSALKLRERTQAVRQYMVWHFGKDQASAHGCVQIRRRDGSLTFSEH